MLGSSVYPPRSVPQVMVSSTFKDLKEHRAAMIAAIHDHNLHAKVMEHSGAKASGDVIDASLKMVRDSAAYILVIGFKYGQTPVCPDKNPKKLSITELEFDEAQRLNRPTLLFIMDDKHPVTKGDVETVKWKVTKLDAFRERAKKKVPASYVDRVYSVFDSLEDFQKKIGGPLNGLCQILESKHEEPPKTEASAQPSSNDRTIPAPPDFYAERDYIGRHTFIGRVEQLKTLSEWAKPTDRANVLLFEAIGGNGKSMLTWEWATKHAENARTGHEPWAGRFWYSFYEKGAIMRGFCQHALAYMTGQPLEAFEKRPMADLHKELLVQLHQRPWLLILDGLERVLVAYHRIDASEVTDEEVNRPTDKILDRNPCDAIRDEDTDLLRALAAATPSKILISSRLIPRVLLNQSGIPLPGVKPLMLPGLDEADAEALLCSCGVRGKSEDVRYYLTNYCANHPLVIGVLAGLINSPGPHRGDFDGWAADPAYGAKLNLASLDLIQSRNHILRAALDALEPPSRQLLSTLALLSDAVDYDTVAAFNPHIPPEPEEVENPTQPEKQWRWDKSTDEGKAKLREQYEVALANRKAYEQAMQAWRDAASEAPKKLADTMQDLEYRGLLQYDGRTQRYDMHPVVRGVAAGGMKAEDKQHYGQRVVDHFNSKPHPPYEQAKTMEDVENGLHVVRTLLKLGKFEDGVRALNIDLFAALTNNLDADAEALALLRPFFPIGWGELPTTVSAEQAANLAGAAGIVLSNLGEDEKALSAQSCRLRFDLKEQDWDRANTCLYNIGSSVSSLAKQLRLARLSLDLGLIRHDRQEEFHGRLRLFVLHSIFGQWKEAEFAWQQLDVMGRNWSRGSYAVGDAERCFVRFQYYQGFLCEEHLCSAERVAIEGNSRSILRDLHRSRGFWRLGQQEWTLASASLTEAIRMARERGFVDTGAETGLALAKYHLGQLNGDDVFCEAERLTQVRWPAHRTLALLWLALGDLDQAKHHALAAYQMAWDDGEPYVYRYALTKTTELLQQMNVPVPVLPPYDPAKDEPFPWEADVRAAIEKLKAEKEKSVSDE